MSHFIEIREVFSEILYPAQFIIEELLYVFHEQLTTNVGRSAPLQRYDKENCLFTFHLESRECQSLGFIHTYRAVI